MGNFLINSSAPAIFAAAITSDKGIPGCPKLIFSRIVPPNKNVSWSTTPICCRKERKERLVISCPSIKTLPSVGGYKPITNLEMVVFPEPLRPTKATICPGLISKLRFSNILISLSG